MTDKLPLYTGKGFIYTMLNDAAKHLSAAYYCSDNPNVYQEVSKILDSLNLIIKENFK